MGPGDDTVEREPRLARRSPFVLSAKLCPRCLSPMGPVPNSMGGLYGIAPTYFECPKCGYAGTLYLEKEPVTGTGRK